MNSEDLSSEEVVYTEHQPIYMLRNCLATPAKTAE